mmetsp:Transcript_4536/g.6255  ORF Transcript_4536/g.6255 Transcript_4536/m.6255 type:complete len:651 (+) Transcript_4536:175-2127(+)|eukprot:CAMPEP_0117762266 /NCGR_PEP_ID=MMETSP0947-20121206/17824_1 /TAXON_ID=44440 /ORGANISM="Chattonella subsalsa, Strain CCMP2191" /LENGTH=650 /DNA_ID=CAMNT_0005583517 /DNA_START=85 /DNA_END=2037 /DNA_ORIENTATION=-
MEHLKQHQTVEDPPKDGIQSPNHMIPPLNLYGDLQRANQTICQLRNEVEVLKGVLFVVKEDLNVKNEQFDYLYASLRAAHDHREQERTTTERFLADRVAALELDIQSKDAQLKETQDQLRQAVTHAPKSGLALFSQLPAEVVPRVFGYLPAGGLCGMAGTCKALAAVANGPCFWAKHFRARFGDRVAREDYGDLDGSGMESSVTRDQDGFTSSEDQRCTPFIPGDPLTGCKWKTLFRKRYVVDNNWVRGRAEVMALSGHSGTVTALQFSRRHHPGPASRAPATPTRRAPGTPSSSGGGMDREKEYLVSGSDDGSLVLWELKTAEEEHAVVLPPPPPALPLAQLVKPTPQQRNRRPLRKKDTSSPSSLEQSNVLSPAHAASSGAAELRSKSSQGSFCGNRRAERLHAFHGHGGPVWCLEFDLEADRLVSGSYDKTLKIWELGSGRCLRTLRGHDGWVSCLALLREDRRIVSGSWDNTIRVWDESTGANLLAMQTGLMNALHCLRWDDRRQLVGVGCRHRQLQLYDLGQGVQVGACTGHLKEVSALHMGDIWVTGSADSTVKLWDPETQTCELTLRGHSHTVMAVQHDGNFRVVSGSYDRTIKLWDIRNPLNPIQSFDKHTAAIFALQFDEDKIISGSADHSMKIFQFNKIY